MATKKKVKKETKAKDFFAKYRVSIEEAMTISPEAFCNLYLFPFMRREAGNGFGMEYWNTKVEDSASPIDGKIYHIDQVTRDVPACGSVMCIGGSMQTIVGNGDRRVLAAILGLTNEDAYGLFYHWIYTRVGQRSVRRQWPEDLSDAFEKAKTPQEKEQVAEQAILRAVRTEGECLRQNPLNI